ncbi:hypothetical protein, partial [Klebsiella pneumoniae]|uniref:hypothetical protein n=3 Tax=Klebsiella pneumoniae TaxID=573 RepID=UPI001C6FF41A
LGAHSTDWRISLAQGTESLGCHFALSRNRPHNVIAGRRRTRFLNVLKTGFPAAPATLHGHAINCVPVHRFRMGRTPETGLTLAEWREFSRYALACILMHAVKQSLRVSGGFSGGLLPVLPVSCQKRPEAVLAVRTIRALC